MIGASRSKVTIGPARRRNGSRVARMDFSLHAIAIARRLKQSYETCAQRTSIAGLIFRRARLYLRIEVGIGETRRAAVSRWIQLGSRQLRAQPCRADARRESGGSAPIYTHSDGIRITLPATMGQRARLRQAPRDRLGATRAVNRGCVRSAPRCGVARDRRNRWCVRRPRVSRSPHGRSLDSPAPPAAHR
jgi:hypothetical protein